MVIFVNKRFWSNLGYIILHMDGHMDYYGYPQQKMMAWMQTVRMELCTDSGFIDLSTGQECSDAVIYGKLFNCKANCQYQGSWQTKHKECFICDSGEMYFN